MMILRSVAAILLVGDGVIAALIPTRHSQRWAFGPRWWRSWMEWYARHPRLTRLLAVGEAAFGLALARAADE